ncbi:MAG TPA: hypothetical protein VML19_10395 [Verrucomicrobiae bacterium]|nr:hypothetical protein [Verrucomicrobiae bacterium]
MISLNTALDGMQQAETSFNRAANKIATPSPNDSLPTDVVDLNQAKSDFEANVKTAEVYDDMVKETLNLLA